MPNLSRERVLRAAIALADREGIESVTMRRLAEKLGAGAMSLYYHVPNKDALLDGMVDIVFSEIELPPANEEWKSALRRRAVSTRQALTRHPWAVGLMEATKAPGPADLRLHDAVLGCLRRAGFSVAMAVQAYSVQDAYIYGFALQEKALPLGGREGFAKAARKRVREVETRLQDVARLYPNLAEVVGGYIAEHGYSAAEAFEVGLDVILDGLERLRRE
ncbi:MAG TPA: TetR/AcrR family transcriptional regulator C-terminal domain-containing protein [Candidatus Dormibacteraeota bacterium]|nr:TetR/AcrR family transcriptional regulator C-terminal domain-containing protein [Candidatus Dormibacteraeota bacterium]